MLLLTSYSNMLGIKVLLEGDVSPSDHAHEVTGGDEGHIGQGQLAGWGGGHKRALEFEKIIDIDDKKL